MDNTKIENKRSWWRKILYVVGIDALSIKGWNVHLRPRFFIIIASIFGFFFISLLAVGKYSTSPSFCNSCHIMEPYYNAWNKSAHSHVACIDCHYPPGTPRTILWKKFQAMSQIVKYVTRTYSSKPFAEIEDSSCLRSGCHTTGGLKGRFISKNGIKFDHKEHIAKLKNGKQLKCVTCHSQIVVGRHVEVTYDSCYLCHLKEKNGEIDFKLFGRCLGCHEVPKKTFELDNMTYNHETFIKNKGVSCRDCHLEVVQGSGEVPLERCFACHNQPEKLSQYENVAFIHNNHITEHNVACFHCHHEIRHGFIYEKGKSNAVNLDSNHLKLATLENKRKEKRPPTLTFKCSHCHKGNHSSQLSIYSGDVVSLGLPEMPSPMFLAHVDCIGCHYYNRLEMEEGDFNGETLSASDKSCIKCHGLKFKGIWEKTAKELKKTLTKLSSKIEAVDAAIINSSLPQDELGKINEKMKKVKLWYDFIYTSKGEHNIYLASWIIRQSDALLNEIEKSMDAKFANISSLPLISGRYCSSLCHFKVGIKPKMKVNAFGKEMSHMGHAATIACVECHNIGSHKSITLKDGIQETVCIKCHDDKK